MTRAEEAVALFTQGFSCSQAVLAACGKESGLPREILLKAASGFGGGMARMGGTCGAVTGALMALGLAFGNTEASDAEAKEKTYARAREFMEIFKEKQGSLICRDLLGFELKTPEGRLAAKESGRLETFCPVLVRSAAEILEGLL
jgi:C_GCAxxG_C_C family probable redox protein